AVVRDLGEVAVAIDDVVAADVGRADVAVALDAVDAVELPQLVPGLPVVAVGEDQVAPVVEGADALLEVAVPGHAGLRHRTAEIAAGHEVGLAEELPGEEGGMAAPARHQVA